MKHIGWIIILLGALVVVVTACDANDSETARHNTGDIVYKAGLMDVRKITVDGQEYLLAWSPNGVSITRHDKPINLINGKQELVIDSTPAFPTTDSIVRYINKWVRNTPATSNSGGFSSWAADPCPCKTSTTKPYTPTHTMRYNPALKIMTY